MNIEFSTVEQGCTIGLLAAIAWLVIQALASAIRFGWNWVDEGERYMPCNFVNAICAKITGWRINERPSATIRFTEGLHGETDGALFIFIPAFILMCTPTVLIMVVAWWQYWLALAVGVGLMYLTRFCFRMSKVLRKHMEDKNGHR